MGMQQANATMLHYKNQSCMTIAKNPMFHAKTKHVDVKYHFIRELIEDKQLQLVKVHTTENLADLLTKGLPKASFEQCRTLLGIGQQVSTQGLYTIVYSYPICLKLHIGL